MDESKATPETDQTLDGSHTVDGDKRPDGNSPRSTGTIFERDRPVDIRSVIFSGPAGGGKTTLIRMLLERYTGMFRTPVEHTTRPPRAGEQDGVDYFFTTKDKFYDMIISNSFVVYYAHDENYYGVSLASFFGALEVDVVTLLEVPYVFLIPNIQLRNDIPARYVFISPPTLPKMEERLRLRATESLEEIRSMLARSKADFAHANMNHIVIFNDELEVAFRKLCNFIWDPTFPDRRVELAIREGRTFDV